MKEGYLKLYRETFTQEIYAQIAFSESPVGKSVVEKTSALSAKGAQVLQQRYLPVVQRMQKSIKEEIRKGLKGGIASTVRFPYWPATRPINKRRPIY